MPGKSIPMPENYIVWRDNQGRYHVAKRPADLRPPLPSRTRAVQWAWGEFGRLFDTHFVEEMRTEEETSNHD